MYPLIKYIHVGAVGLSLAGFLLRTIWRFRSPQRLRLPLVRTLPHINDTVLLASGATMAWLLRWSPFSHHWLAAKLVALLIYILLGATVLRTSNQTVATGALIAAVTMFLYMVLVAVTKSVRPWEGTL